MEKLIYEVYYRHEGCSWQAPDELYHEVDIYDNGYWRCNDHCKGAEYEWYKNEPKEIFEKWYQIRKRANEERSNKYGGDVVEIPRRLMREEGIFDCEPWEHYENLVPFTNTLYPAAFFTLWQDGYVWFAEDDVVPAERFYHEDDGLLLDENGRRGYISKYVIKYHGEGKPWEKHFPWTNADGEIDYDEKGDPIPMKY